MKPESDYSGAGRRIRLGRLFRQDGHAVCVAADHGFMTVPKANVFNIRSILSAVIDGGIDGVLLSPGQTIRLVDLFRGRNAPAVLVRCDWINAARLPIASEHALVPTEKLRRTVSIRPKDALRLGATAIVSYLILGYEDSYESENILSVAGLTRESHAVGLPIAIEPIVFGAKVTGSNFAEILEYGVKLSVHLGADFLKVPYSGSISSFQRIVSAAEGVPILVLGGSRSIRPHDSLDMAKDAKIAGARGVVFGRNITQAEAPGWVTRGLCHLFHGDRIESEKKRKKVVVNPNLCTDCRLCMLACNFEKTGNYGFESAVLRIDDTERGSPKIHFCIECGLCVEACEQGALSMNGAGGIKLEAAKCTGCGRCVEVCPQGVLKLSDDRSFVYTCDLCEGTPACVNACPTGAISLQDREVKNENVL